MKALLYLTQTVLFFPSAPSETHITTIRNSFIQIMSKLRTNDDLPHVIRMCIMLSFPIKNPDVDMHVHKYEALLISCWFILYVFQNN